MEWLPWLTQKKLNIPLVSSFSAAFEVMLILLSSSWWKECSLTLPNHKRKIYGVLSSLWFEACAKENWDSRFNGLLKMQLREETSFKQGVRCKNGIQSIQAQSSPSDDHNLQRRSGKHNANYADGMPKMQKYAGFRLAGADSRRRWSLDSVFPMHKVQSYFQRIFVSSSEL